MGRLAMFSAACARKNALLALAGLAWGSTCDGVFDGGGWDADSGQPEYCTMFNHMVKSGGTSIRNQLSRNSAQQGHRRFPVLCSIGPGTEEGCIEAVNHAAVIVGYVEMLRHPMEKAGRECQYFTMMRHPIQRLISAFYYCPNVGDPQARPAKWCGGEPSDEPITERLLDFARVDWQCKAMYQLSFSNYCPPGGFCQEDPSMKPPTEVIGGDDWDTLALAQLALGNYTAVGIFEHWYLSLDLFQATVKSPVVQWDSKEKANPGQVSFEREELIKWAHSSPEIRKVIAGDLLLYDMAVALFKRQTAEALGTVWEDS